MHSIDITNSQPYLSCLLFNPEFWDSDSKLSLNIGHLPENVQELFSSNDLMQSIHRFFASVSIDSFAEYMELASTGKIYEVIMGAANKRKGPEEAKIERKEAKTMMFSLLFSKNGGRSKTRRIGNMKRLFTQELFLPVAEFFRIVKEKYDDVEAVEQHARLAILLQAIESEIILHRCCKRIWEEQGGKIPIFTIHDSIGTLPEHVEYVRQVMDNELTSCIGLSPQFSIETWTEDKLDGRLLQLAMEQE